MNNVILLFKKDFAERFSSTFHKEKGRKDVFGILSTFLLLALLYGTFIFVYYRFAKMYVSTTFEVANAAHDRAYELLTMIYGAVFLINVAVGAKNIHSALSESRDIEVLLCQPISSGELFAYKFLKIYFAQFLSTVLVLLPACIVVDVLSPLGGGGYYVALVSHLFLAPMVSCAVASLIAIPINYVIRFISNRFILHLLVYIAILGVSFWAYSLFLEQLTSLIQSGDLKFVFDRLTITRISNVTANLYPVNLFSNMLVGKDLVLSVLVILAIGVVGFTASWLLIRAMYNKILQKRMEGELKTYHKKKKIKFRSPMASLMYKEFIVILRTPSYAFQYFATTFTLPLMVYVCVNLMQSMMKSLTVVQCDYEIAIFVISMFAVLTNTFCTTNVSRDGKMLGMLKTLPIEGKTVIWSKILFCLAVSEFSILASSVVLLAVGYLNWWQTIVIFVFASLLSFAEIAFATRKDLAKPNLPDSEREEVEEGNNTISAVIFLGLNVSIIMGAGAVALSLILSIAGTSEQALAASICFVAIIVIAVFVGAFVYLVKGLNEKFYTSEN